MKSNSLCLCCLAVLILFGFGSDVFASRMCDDFRTWKDGSGKFEIEAKFISAENDRVVLEKRDGKRLTIALDKLSPIDQGFVQGRMSSSDDGNPFEEMDDGDRGNNAESGSNKADGRDNGGKIENYDVDFTRCSETVITKGHWQPALGLQPELP